MKIKDILLVVGGVVLGYFASKMNWGKNTSVQDIATGVVDTATGLVTDVKDVAIDTVKMAKCQAKLLEQTSTMRFVSAEAGDLFKKDFLTKCMASK